MMAFLLGNSANFIHEGQRLGEVFEFVKFFEMAGFVKCPPTVELFQHFSSLCSDHWRNTTTARHAFIIC
jgi:hypothetical protein